MLLKMLVLFTSPSNKQIGNSSQDQGCPAGPEAMAYKERHLMGYPGPTLAILAGFDNWHLMGYPGPTLAILASFDNWLLPEDWVLCLEHVLSKLE